MTIEVIYKRNPKWIPELGNANTVPEMLPPEEIVTPDPPKFPITLSKTAFRAHCVVNFGGGMTGIARFQEIMDGCEAGSGVIKFCFGEYTAAATFDKDKTAQFLAIISSLLVAGEAEKILTNWPEA